MDPLVRIFRLEQRQFLVFGLDDRIPIEIRYAFVDTPIYALELYLLRCEIQVMDSQSAAPDGLDVVVDEMNMLKILHF